MMLMGHADKDVTVQPSQDGIKFFYITSVNCPI